MRPEAPIANFDHALVLSPLVADLFNERQPETVLRVHNYRGAVARVTRGEAFELALSTGETHSLTPKEVLDRLEAFVRTA